MKARDLARLLAGMPHDAEVKVLGRNGMARLVVSHVEIRETPVSFEVIIVTIGNPG